MEKGIIYDIQGFSVHDGEGIRTTFFLKGCPLRCRWCHNPEGLKKELELQYIDEKCIACQKCKEDCGCHGFTETAHSINRSECKKCFDCTKICPSKALNIIGQEYSSDEVLELAKKDIAFYGQSGGVTFSGGEATMQPQFLAECLKKCKEARLNTAVDTSGFCNFGVFEKIIPYADLFLYDIKAITKELHIAGTGVDNSGILDNFIKLQEKGCRIWVRIPVIPDFNADEAEIKKIADFLHEHNRFERLELMPYHILGANKYAQIGLEPAILSIISKEKLRDIRVSFHGLPLI